MVRGKSCRNISEMENKFKQKKSVELLSLLLMAENWAVIKTLLQDWKWHGVFSPSLCMD